MGRAKIDDGIDGLSGSLDRGSGHLAPASQVVSAFLNSTKGWSGFVLAHRLTSISIL